LGARSGIVPRYRRSQAWRLFGSSLSECSNLCLWPVPPVDSNLRSRLRRAWRHPALSSGNVPAGDTFGHVLDTVRITAGHGLADRRWSVTSRGSDRRVSLILHLVYRTGRGRLACHEHAHTGGRGPPGSWTAAGHPATRRRGAEPDPVPPGRGRDQPTWACRSGVMVWGITESQQPACTDASRFPSDRSPTMGRPPMARSSWLGRAERPLLAPRFGLTCLGS
jgi:hypothetical protein